MSRNNDCIFLSRKEAAAYLCEIYGKPGAVKPSTLAKYACVGGGPVYHRFGRKVGYKPSDLDKWALSRCSRAQQKPET